MSQPARAAKGTAAIVKQDELAACHALHPMRRLADRISHAFHRSRRIIVVTGAGISVSGGIPDFRSCDGLYKQVKQRYPKAVMTGKDLFDATLFRDQHATQVFFSFMGEFKQVVDGASHTPTHSFLKALNDRKKLTRCYTQNIDCMEERLGLCCDLENAAAEVVLLHGSLSNVVCTVCRQRTPYEEKHVEDFKTGVPPPCDKCSTASAMREAANRRALPVGILRPDIILYNEHHAAGDHIAMRASADIRKRPDLLVVMGTSLKVAGIKRLVKELAREVCRNNSTADVKCLLVNKTDLTASKEWSSVFDTVWLGDTDAAVQHIEAGMCKLEREEAEKKKARERRKSAKENLLAGQPTILDSFVTIKSASKITLEKPQQSPSGKKDATRASTPTKAAVPEYQRPTLSSAKKAVAGVRRSKQTSSNSSVASDLPSLARSGSTATDLPALKDPRHNAKKASKSSKPASTTALPVADRKQAPSPSLPTVTCPTVTTTSPKKQKASRSRARLVGKGTVLFGAEVSTAAVVDAV